VVKRRVRAVGAGSGASGEGDRGAVDGDGAVFRPVDFLFAVAAAMQQPGEFGGAVAGADAARQGAPPGEDDQRQFPQGATDQDVMKVQRVADGQQAAAPGGRLDDVGHRDAVEALQFVGRHRRGRGEDRGIGAGVEQRAAGAFRATGDAGQLAQGVPEGAAQHRAAVIR